jgi:hypothetical protein
LKDLSDFPLDSRNENLPEKYIHRNYARNYASARAACRAGFFVARAARAAAALAPDRSRHGRRHLKVDVNVNRASIP